MSKTTTLEDAHPLTAPYSFISCIGVGARGITISNMLIAVMIFYGGICQFRTQTSSSSPHPSALTKTSRGHHGVHFRQHFRSHSLQQLRCLQHLLCQ